LNGPEPLIVNISLRARRHEPPLPTPSPHCRFNEPLDRPRRVYNRDTGNMSGFLENAYSLVHQDNAADVPSVNDLRNQLEKGTDESKVETMKRILTIMLNGDPMPTLLMHIIRFVMPSRSKSLKKLLYFYYEICPKLDSSGKLKQEMILVW
jgi:hypothetical protein